MSTAKENILKKIRTALSQEKVAMPFPEAEKITDFFSADDMGIEEKFATEFMALGGKFVYCADEKELISQLDALRDTMQWQQMHVRDSFLQQLFQEHQLSHIQSTQQLENIEVGISLCECLVARTGSVILSGGQEYGRTLPVYAPIHITIAFADQIVYNISNAIELLKQKYHQQLPSLISLTTGPSRTADIEKTLVVGVHGPKEVYVFLVDKHWKN